MNISGTTMNIDRMTVDGKDLKTTIEPFTYHSAAAHNAIYRGKDLGTFSEAHSAAIRAGTFNDIYIGDCWKFSNVPYTYLDKNDEEQSSTYSGTIRVADFDYYLRTGNTDLLTHHAIVVPDVPMFHAPMNDTDTTEGGYVESKMRTVYLRRAEAIFKACFGENHVLKHPEYLVNAVKDGKPSAGAWYNCLVELMDERMVYGTFQYDSASPDGSGGNNPGATFNRYSVSCKQLNLFRYNPVLISNKQWTWLRNVVSATCFALVGSNVTSSYCNASNSGGGVRPFALIY